MMNKWLWCLDQAQHDFPLVHKPFAVLAERWEMDEADVLALFATARQQGVLGRIGAVFTPHVMGVSTLAAMRVPAADIERVAAIVSASPGVNHNYLRDHVINLWFVVVAESADVLDQRLKLLHKNTGLPVLDLRLEEEFHINLAFSLHDKPNEGGIRLPTARPSVSPSVRLSVDSTDQVVRNLANCLSEGLPLVSSPYHELAMQLECDEHQVLEQIKTWRHQGVIRRFGAVLNHRALGFTHNGMCVWNVPDDKVSELGFQVAKQSAVTLCYRRRRSASLRAQGWSYNLFAMIHGQDADTVREQAHDITRRCGLVDFDADVLFSTRCFKQRGARYFNTEVPS